MSNIIYLHFYSWINKLILSFFFLINRNLWCKRPCDVSVWWFEGPQTVLQRRCLDAWDSDNGNKKRKKKQSEQISQFLFWSIKWCVIQTYCTLCPVSESLSRMYVISMPSYRRSDGAFTPARERMVGKISKPLRIKSQSSWWKQKQSSYTMLKIFQYLSRALLVLLGLIFLGHVTTVGTLWPPSHVVLLAEPPPAQKNENRL